MNTKNLEKDSPNRTRNKREKRKERTENGYLRQNQETIKGNRE